MFKKTRYYPVNINTKQIIDRPFRTHREVLREFLKTDFIGIKGDRLNKCKCYQTFEIVQNPFIIRERRKTNECRTI